MSLHQNASLSSNTLQSDLAHDAPRAAPAAPFSAAFWDADARTARIRKAYVRTLARGTLLTALAILAILAIYWGAAWKIGDYVHTLDGWVVDFDGGAVGRAVQAAAANATGPRGRISWTAVPPARFAQGPPDVARAVLDEQAWVAIVVNPGATAALASAVASVDAAYDPAVAVAVYAVEARNEHGYPQLILPMVQAVMGMATTVFTDQHAKQIASNPNISTLLSTAPALVTRPLYYTVSNLHPFDVPAASAADFVGLIFLLIIAFLIANLNFAARVDSGLARHLTLRSLIHIRFLSAIVMYFFLSLVFALLSLAFQIPFDRMFGPAGFVIFWMLCWIAMCALGLALEAMITLITPRFTPYFLILWIIVNVSVCYYPIETLPPVFRYGYATPFYNVARAVRTIIFSTRNQVGLNFGVEFAWIAVSAVTIPLFQWLARRREVHELRANALLEKAA